MTKKDETTEEYEQSTTELTDYCNYFYQLTLLHAEREKNLNALLDGAPIYSGETELSEIDVIIAYYREVQAAKKELEETLKQLKNTERCILNYITYFEIPRGMFLRGAIPGEAEYAIWADDQDAVQVYKTKNLAPVVDEANVVTIKLCRG